MLKIILSEEIYLHLKLSIVLRKTDNAEINLAKPGKLILRNPIKEWILNYSFSSMTLKVVRRLA